VVLADDQTMVRAGLRTILDVQDGIEVVGEAADGFQAVEEVSRLHPDVVVMDVRMPRMDGIESTRRLRELGLVPPARVVILTTFDLDEYVYAALRAGADGFLLKDAPPETLAEGIRVVAAGDAMLAPPVTRRLIHAFSERPAPAAGRRDPAVLEQLTERERDVLRLLAHGLPNAEIAATLHVTQATVKSHVNHVLAKLGLDNRVQAAILAPETGLAGTGPDPG
jgi:DNA-binding NarL/FixJ family response regulator